MRLHTLHRLALGPDYFESRNAHDRCERRQSKETAIVQAENEILSTIGILTPAKEGQGAADDPSNIYAIGMVFSVASIGLRLAWIYPLKRLRWKFQILHGDKSRKFLPILQYGFQRNLLYGGAGAFAVSALLATFTAVFEERCMEIAFQAIEALDAATDEREESIYTAFLYAAYESCFFLYYALTFPFQYHLLLCQLGIRDTKSLLPSALDFYPTQKWRSFLWYWIYHRMYEYIFEIANSSVRRRIPQPFRKSKSAWGAHPIDVFGHFITATATLVITLPLHTMYLRAISRSASDSNSLLRIGQLTPANNLFLIVKEMILEVSIEFLFFEINHFFAKRLSRKSASQETDHEDTE